MFVATLAGVGLALGASGIAHADVINSYWNTNPEGVAGASGEGDLWKTTSGSNWDVHVRGKVWDTAGDSKSARIRVKVRNSGGQISYHRATNSGGHNSTPKSFEFGFRNAQKVWITECTFNVWGEDCGKEWQIYSRF
ncbi:hypothetical protein [Longispora urticae]